MDGWSFAPPALLPYLTVLALAGSLGAWVLWLAWQSARAPGARPPAATPSPTAAIANLAWQREVTDLRNECLRLRAELEAQQQQALARHRTATFQRLQTLLVQYPSARRLAARKPDLPAQNLTALFSALDDLLGDWGYDTIGRVWERVAFDPQLHQADASDAVPGELMYVRFVGYRLGDRILVPAKVSRTLPSGAAPS